MVQVSTAIHTRPIASQTIRLYHVRELTSFTGEMTYQAAGQQWEGKHNCHMSREDSGPMTPSVVIL